MKVRSVMQRMARFVNPPGLPGDSGSFPHVRDYPVSRQSTQRVPGRNFR
jgi:hypothetical protein